MKKHLTVALTGAMALGLAAPAIADHDIGGFMALIPTFQNGGGPGKDADDDKIMDQRLRFKLINTPSDLVKVTWYAEVDTVWGKANGTTSKGFGGGATGADATNVETKNAYADINIPDSPVSMRLGVQWFTDTAMRTNFFFNDFAAALVNYNADMATVQFGFSRPTADDELYLAKASFTPMEGTKLDVDIYHTEFEDDNVDAVTTVGAAVNTKIDAFEIDAFVSSQFGDSHSGTLASAMVGGMFGDVTASAKVIYGTDDDKGEQWTDQITAGQAYALGNFFPNTGLNILLTNGAFNTGNMGFAKSALNAGDGLMGFVANAGFKVADYSILAAAGIFNSLEDGAAGEKDLGSEVGVEVKRAFLDGGVKMKFDANYAMMGDYFGDVDDHYRVACQLIMPF